MEASKRLSENCANSIELMENSEIQGRGVLFQLPPQFSKNRERSALDMLPRCYPYAFEFRHKSWYEDDIINPLCARRRSGHHGAPLQWEMASVQMIGGSGALWTWLRSR